MISRIRIALLTSVVVASALCPIRADEKADDKDKKDPVPEKKEPLPPPVIAPGGPGGPIGPAGPGCGGCGAPQQFQTICVQEWVPEYYKTTRTTYKRECVPETYTAYR